jgi:hypothetical protein
MGSLYDAATMVAIIQSEARKLGILEAEKARLCCSDLCRPLKGTLNLGRGLKSGACWWDVHYCTVRAG